MCVFNMGKNRVRERENEEQTVGRILISLRGRIMCCRGYQ
jgi:hypothetical protein